jgi:hypothetical protein
LANGRIEGDTSDRPFGEKSREQIQLHRPHLLNPWRGISVPEKENCCDV